MTPRSWSFVMVAATEPGREFAWASAGGQRHIASAFPVDFARACFSPSLDGWPCTHYRAHRLPRPLFGAGLLDLLIRLFAATPD
jgi:hypothetical protein